MTILVISNEERSGIMEIIKSLEKIGFLIRTFSKKGRRVIIVGKLVIEAGERATSAA